MGCVYFGKVEGQNIFKIGSTKNDTPAGIDDRLNMSLKSAIERGISDPQSWASTYYGKIETEHHRDVEKVVHYSLADEHKLWEWFNLTPQQVDGLIQHGNQIEGIDNPVYLRRRLYDWGIVADRELHSKFRREVYVLCELCGRVRKAAHRKQHLEVAEKGGQWFEYPTFKSPYLVDAVELATAQEHIQELEAKIIALQTELDLIRNTHERAVET